MHSLESRYNCPVCLGAMMHKLKLGKKDSLILDSCKRCGGIWFDYGEIQKLRNFQPKFLFNKIELNKETFRMQCHSCHCFISRNSAKCVKCGWENIIECPTCSEPMKVKIISNLHLDYCETCKGVWFDNIELSEIWNNQLASQAKKHLIDAKTNSSKSYDVSSLFIDVLEFDPTLIYYGAEASIEVGKIVIETSANIISNSPEIAGSLLEGTAEIAGAVFETIATIIGGLFDGL